MTRYARSKEALHSAIGDDVVALNIENGRCYGMEEVTVAIWNLLAEPVSVDSICEKLIEAYDVRPDVCRQDVDRLIGQLEKEGLVQSVPG
jgi:hypothetical protein